MPIYTYHIECDDLADGVTQEDVYVEVATKKEAIETIRKKLKNLTNRVISKKDLNLGVIEQTVDDAKQEIYDMDLDIQRMTIKRDLLKEILQEDF